MRIRHLVALLLTASIGACTTSDASPSPSTVPASRGEPIVIGLSIPPFAPSPFFSIRAGAAFRAPARPEIVAQMVYNGLYRYDGTLSPVPDLAGAPCEVGADQVTIVCRLVETSFHDGTPLTAADVAFTFELGRRSPSPACTFAYGTCFGEMLESATAVDEHTVEFRLSRPDATFLTLVLPSVMIDSRAVVEAAYASLGERAATLEAVDYQEGADALFAQLGSDDPDCEGPLDEAEALFRAAGIEPLPRDQFDAADGRFDSCMYAESSAIRLSAIAASLDTTGLDAIARAYVALSFNRSPVGTGPWRFVSVEDGTRVILEAFDGFHRGPPATPRVEVRLIRDAAAVRDGLLSGELDWVALPPDLYPQIEDASGLQFGSYADPTYYMLAYNVREGMLFAEHELRTAVELCIDKPATVDAATDGTGDVIYTPIDPASWAYQADLPRPARDVQAARGLIESAGWTAGEDGIYERDGARLATDVFVRGDTADRVAFMDLLAEQVRDCGIELTVIPADVETVLGPLEEYPHIPGGYEEPFQALFIGWSHGLDPHDELWHSNTVTSPEQPVAPNFMGFSDPQVDELLDAGLTTYDQRERARIYRDLQHVLAEERPVLFGWAGRVYEALDERLGLTEGELDLGSRQWFWEPEKLVLRDADPG